MSEPRIPKFLHQRLTHLSWERDRSSWLKIVGKVRIMADTQNFQKTLLNFISVNFMLYLWDENSEQTENCAAYLINSASTK